MRKTNIKIAALLFGALLATAALSRGQENGEVALRAAMETETVEGDLRSAILQYERLAESSDRSIAAKALIRMAGCYEKLGAAESRKIYEKVLRDFGDQKEAAQVARARLETMERPLETKGDRVVWSGMGAFGDGRISPDGRFFSDVDWNWTGALMLYDLVSGTGEALTEGWDGPGNAMASAFSPDGRQIAFGWKNYDPRRCEVRVLNLDERGIAKARRVYENKDIRFLSVTDWSSDGKWLAVRLMRQDSTEQADWGTVQIGVLKVEDGSLRILKSVGLWRGPEQIFFSPDARYLAYDLPTRENDSERDVFVLDLEGAHETNAVEHPAFDRLMGWSTDGHQLLFASDRTGSMGLWAVPVAQGRPQSPPALLKPGVGPVYSLGLTAHGVLHVVKDASTQSLQVAPIDLNSGRLTGVPLVQGYRSHRPDWSPDGDYLAFRSDGVDDVPLLSILSTRTGKVRELSPGLHYFNEPRWMPDGQSLVTFGRDFKGRAGIYRINAQKGTTSFIAASGLCRVQVSPDGENLYFISPDRHSNGYLQLNLKSGESRIAITRNDADGSYSLSPDGRYFATIRQDLEAGTSSIVLIPVAEAEEREVLRINSPEKFLSYGYLSWTPNSQGVIVIKVRREFDSYSDDWSIPRVPAGMEGKRELWLVSAVDGSARKLEIDISDWNGPFRLNPDGDRIAFFTGKVSRELWALESLLPGESATR